jgi:hypothetical protein
MCHHIIHQATQRMEGLRTTVERLAEWRGNPDCEAQRSELERALDRVRGNRNRALARLEAVRLAEDDSWVFSRSHADQAIATFCQSVDEVESHLHRAAA